MKKEFFFIIFLLPFFGKAQTLDGIYTALEFISIAIDTSGQVDFYKSESFPKEKWFHETVVVIRDTKFSIEKSPVYFDSTGKKIYSASDGGFLTYLGTIKKVGQIFIATANLVGYDHTGISFFDPPRQPYDEDTSHIGTTVSNSKVPSLKEVGRKYDVLGDSDGNWTCFPKGTITKDYIIRPERNGLWINNVFYRKVKA